MQLHLKRLLLMVMNSVMRDWIAMKGVRLNGRQVVGAGVVFSLLLFALPSADAAILFGHVVQVEQLSFHPDEVSVPGDNFAVLVVQNREDGPCLLYTSDAADE